MSNDDLAEDACIEIEEQRVNLILAFGTLTGKVMHVDAEGAVCLLIEVSRRRAEVEKLRAERDTLLLDARDFVRWFNRHHPDPSRDPDHPWCALNDRLNAHADTLATFDSGVEIKEEEDER